MATSVDTLLEKLVQFRNERGWEVFHTPRNLILALVGEIGELAALVQWKSDDELNAFRSTEEGKSELGQELADVVSYVLLLADALDLDVVEEVSLKLDLNARRYPIDESYGRSAKYTELS